MALDKFVWKKRDEVEIVSLGDADSEVTAEGNKQFKDKQSSLQQGRKGALKLSELPPGIAEVEDGEEDSE